MKFGTAAIEVVDEIITDNEFFYIRLSRYPSMTNVSYWKYVRQILCKKIQN